MDSDNLKLVWERQGKLTDFEKQILGYLIYRFEYIARDKDDSLYAYNQEPEKRRELMDYETRLKDERLIGIKEGRIEERNRNARNIIIAFKANNAAPSFIFQFVKSAFKDDLTDEEIQQMIDEVEERN